VCSSDLQVVCEFFQPHHEDQPHLREICGT
jgi:hypothetical protein